MKKKSLLALSSIVLAVGLLVGCSEEPGFENDQMQNENSQPGEMELDTPM